MQILTFRVAETCFRLEFSDMTDARPLLPSYAPFCIENDTPCSRIFEMSIAAGLVSFTPDGKEVGQFDCGGINHGIYELSGGGYKILISNVDGDPACAFTATKGFSACRATLFGNDDNKRFGLNNALMIAFAFAGANCNIVLMHASVTISGEKGFLFLGKSGTGKSTHSSLWLRHIPDCELLNDDNPALRLQADGSVTVYGTPWSGKTPCYRNLSVPVDAIVSLEQFSENVICKENKIKGFADILSSCSTMIWDRNSYTAILDTATDIAARVPVFHLKCRPDEEAARLCHDTVTAG